MTRGFAFVEFSNPRVSCAVHGKCQHGQAGFLKDKALHHVLPV